MHSSDIFWDLIQERRDSGFSKTKQEQHKLKKKGWTLSTQQYLWLGYYSNKGEMKMQKMLKWECQRVQCCVIWANCSKDVKYLKNCDNKIMMKKMLKMTMRKNVENEKSVVGRCDSGKCSKIPTDTSGSNFLPCPLSDHCLHDDHHHAGVDDDTFTFLYTFMTYTKLFYIYYWIVEFHWNFKKNHTIWLKGWIYWHCY